MDCSADSGHRQRAGCVNRLEGNEFSLWANYVYAITRISLDPSKGYLIETRLSVLMRETGSRSYKELLDRVTRGEDREADWRQAEICLANEILDGKITFDVVSASGGYSALENDHWLDDLRQLKAYLVWLHNGDGWTPGSSRTKAR